MLEEIAVKAREETRKHFGNSVCMFTPIYTSNYCQNNCVYCGFNIHNKIRRACLTPDEVGIEMAAIAESGLKEILILTGESRTRSDVDYIGMCVEKASEYFSTIGIEVYPMNTEEYRFLQERGADYVTVFQETYDPERYAELHLAGPKRIFSYRFNANERCRLRCTAGTGRFQEGCLRMRTPCVQSPEEVPPCGDLLLAPEVQTVHKQRGQGESGP